jgi:hypothetical protein
MKKTLSFAAILLMLASAFTCRKDKENEPTEIPFTEYSLTGTDCQWTNLDYDGKVIVINSKAELEKYVTCTSGSYPEIDFAKYTLLLAHGGAQNGIGKITTSLYQNSANKYTLNVKISLGFTMVAEPWLIGIIVSKLPKDAEINLNTQLSHEI